MFPWSEELPCAFGTDWQEEGLSLPWVFWQIGKALGSFWKVLLPVVGSTANGQTPEGIPEGGVSSLLAELGPQNMSRGFLVFKDC